MAGEAADGPDSESDLVALLMVERSRVGATSHREDTERM